MTTITLTNSFHNTECRVSAKWGETAREAWEEIQIRAMEGDESAKRAKRRVRNALCGSHDCTCGTVRD